MQVSASSISFYVSVGADPIKIPKPKKAKAEPVQKYHDTKPCRSPDYSFGTTPPKPDGYLSRPTSPDKSPKL